MFDGIGLRQYSSHLRVFDWIATADRPEPEYSSIIAIVLAF
jgi:hypothetical protein